MNILTRRNFLGGATAAFGSVILPANAFGEGGKPLLKLGVLTDVHVRIGKFGDPVYDAEERFLKALQLMDARKVEAVLFPGDLVDTGRISQLRAFQKGWETVFPNGRSVTDGRKVERLAVTGNHDISRRGWEPYWAKQKSMDDRFYWEDRHVAIWREIFDEDFAVAWTREVKGIPFIGTQWLELKPPTIEYVREYASKFDPKLPFVYVQHIHPKGTCHSWEDRTPNDHGTATKALSPFPNAIALSGHSHITLADESAVWQGAFTSIGCGCAGTVAPTCSGLEKAYVNAGLPFGKNRERLMPSVEATQDGRCCLDIDIYADHLIVHRHSLAYEAPLGEDWCVPLPAAVDGPMSFKARKAKRSAPAFAASDRIAVDFCEKAPKIAGTDWRDKKPCVRVTFPHAQTVDGCRVYDYKIVATSEGRELFSRRFVDFGFAVPEKDANRTNVYLVDPADFPKGKEVVLSVAPCDCFGTIGKPIVSDSFVCPKA